MNESVWDLKQKLAHERNTLKALENSVQRWEEINDDLQKDITNVTTTGNEWKIRYAGISHEQHLSTVPAFSWIALLMLRHKSLKFIHYN